MEKQTALRKLAEFAVLCNRTNDLQKIINTACQIVAETIGTDLAKVLRKVKGSDELYLVAFYGYEKKDFSEKSRTFKESSAAGHAIEKGEDIVSEDANVAQLIIDYRPPTTSVN